VKQIPSVRRARLGILLLPLVVLAGCDPCAGVTCSTKPHVTLTGTIVDPLTGAGARGVKIDLSATDAGGHTAEASTTTDATGVWQATVDLETSGGASATVMVASPKGSTYATTFGVNASTKQGDGTAVGPWTEVPYVQQLLSILVSLQPLAGADVHFQQTSGPKVISSQTDAQTNGAGIFELRFAAQTLGAVVGVLTITHPSLASPIVLNDLAIHLDFHFGIAQVTGTILR
jgi:hypothetical protein